MLKWFGKLFNKERDKEMKPYKEYLQAENVPDYSTRPAPEYVWYAYKNGQVVYCSNISKQDAEKHGNTTIVENVLVNKDIIWTWDELQKQALIRATTSWHSDLREKYSFLNDDVFNLCYDKAYEDGHSAGYDEVADRMINVVRFAEKLLDASK